MNLTCQVCTATTDALLCRRCTDDLAVALTALPGLLDELLVTASRQARTGNGPGRVEREEDPADVEAHLPAWLRTRQGAIALRSTPGPINWAAAELAHTAGNTLTTWARHLAETRGVDVPTDVVPWLLANVDAIRLDEAAGQIHADLTALSARLTWAIDRRAPEVYAGPCNAPDVRVSLDNGQLRPEVGICGADLYGRLGASTVRCEACAAEYDVAERREWLLAQVVDVWARPQVIADALDSMALPVKRKTIDKWASRGILAPVMVDEGRPYYRVGDVIALVQAAAERVAGRITA